MSDARHAVSPACMLALCAAIGSPCVRAEAGATWTPDDISVAQSVSGQPPTASTRFEVAPNGDARITIERREGSTHSSGTIILIGGRWMLSRGFAAPAGRELESLDLAAVNSQLVMVLLTAALPDGPPAPGAPTNVRFAEKNNPIRIATATASAEYAAPWTVVGTVTEPAVGSATSYELSFTYAEQGLSRTVDFAGTVARAKSSPEFPDTMKLAGWKVRRLPESPEPSAGTAASGPVSSGATTTAAAHAPNALTIGELRQLK